MRCLVLILLALVLSGPAAAASLCGEADAEALLSRLAGAWQGAPRVSIETETLSVVREGEVESHALGAEGGFVTPLVEGFTGAPVMLALSATPVQDVDGVDDLLDTVEAADLADLLSDTPCGPEALPQFTGRFAVPGQVSGEVTLIAYFDDRVLMLTEAELTGDWGLAFTTTAVLLTPAAP